MTSGASRPTSVDRWGVSPAQWEAAVERAEARGGVPASHVNDLALAVACAEGNAEAWDYFVREYRPGLLRAADAMDATGRARDLVDALIADLFGIKTTDDGRRSLFVYFHGRSALSTWLNAVLSQRFVDQIRAAKRFTPLIDADRLAEPTPPPGMAPCRAAVQEALADAIAALSARDRLRLKCYYVQSMTLASIGRMLAEHEATVSRHLSRVRRELRVCVERDLAERAGFEASALRDCLRAVMDDSGDLDLSALFARTAAGIVQNGETGR